MHPFINLGFFKIPLYGLCIASGLLLGGLLIYFACKFKKKNFYDFLILAAMSLAFGFAGAKLLFLFTSYPLKQIPKVIAALLFGGNKNTIGQGFVFYGGFIGGFIGMLLGCKIAGCKITEFFEEITFLIPLVHGFGRLGCTFGGCCYGIPYEGPFALHYHNPITSVTPHIGIFPVQPLESLLLFTFAAVMIFLYFRKIKLNLLWYITYYSVVRFVLEFFRGDLERGHAGLFSTSQWISICLFIISLGFSIFLILKKKNHSEETDKNPATQSD